MPQQDPNPPLAHLVLHVARAVGLEGETAQRWLFTLPAIGGVALAFLLGRRLFDERVGLLAAFLLASSPFLILFGRMLRYYGFGLCFAALSVWAFLRLREETAGSNDERASDDRRRGVVYVLATLAMLYSTYLTGFVLLVQNVVALFARRPVLPVRRWIALQVVIVVGYLPWWGALLRTLSMQASGTFTDTVADFNLNWSAIPLKLGYALYSFSAGENLFPWQLGATLPLFAVIAVALYRCRHQPRRSVLLCAALVVVPLVGVSIVTTFLATWSSFVYTAPRVCFSVVFFWLLVAAGIGSFSSGRVRAALVAVVVAVNAFALAGYYQGERYLVPVYAVPWKQAFQDVESACSTGTNTLITDDELIADLYHERGDWSFRPYRIGGRMRRENPEQLLRELRALAPERCHLLVTGRDSTHNPIPSELLGWLDREYERVEDQGYVAIDPTYRQLKSRVLGREGYDYKLRRWVYEKRSP